MVNGGFRERFHLIDCLNNQTLPKKQYELIWVECFDKVSPVLQTKENLKIITLNRVGHSYSMSHCFNEGIRQSTGELIVIPDGDVFVSPHFLEVIIAEHERCDELVMYFRRWDEEKKDAIDHPTIEHLDSVCKIRNPTNYGGCLTVRKKWMLKVNGYEQNSCFEGRLYAGGLDLYTRFRNFGLLIKWHPIEKIYHPWHPGADDRYTGRNIEAQWEIIRRREKSLKYLPYQGIDASFNSEPYWLSEWLEQWHLNQKKKQSKSYRLYYTLKNAVKRVFSKYY